MLNSALIGLLIVPGSQVTSSLAQKNSSDLDERLKRVQKAIEEGHKQSSLLDRTAKNLKMELLQIQRGKVQVAANIRDTEGNIFKLENEIRRLTDRKAKMLALLSGRRDQIAQVISALQRLSRLPHKSVIAYPTSPSNFIRTGIILSGVLPQIKKRAYRLQKNLLSLDLTRAQIAKRKSDLASASSTLDKQRKNMDLILNSKTNARQQTLAARQVEATRLERLTREAQTLRDLFDHLKNERLNQEKPNRKFIKTRLGFPKPHVMPRPLEPRSAIRSKPPLKTRPITAARGDLTFPVIGKINSQYGVRHKLGMTRKGIQIESGPGAQVVAPYNGRIVFAGPFRGYGQLLIIEHGGGYHSLLAGMARIQGSVGQWLLSGEPIAIMDKPLSGRPTLYMEFRKNGRPINPNPWLTSREGKING